MSSLHRLVVLLAAGLALPALAWPLLGSRDEAATAVPDAVVRLRFPFRTAPAPDPHGWQVKATYWATQADQPGVQKETHKEANCTHGELAIPFCATQREKVVVERTLVLRPEWLRTAAGGGIELSVPERLAGPGDYRLERLDLPCLDRACTNGTPRLSTILFSTRTGAASTLPDFIDLGGSDPDGVFTASYAGPLLAMTPSPGSRSDTQDPDRLFLQRALQDATGRWHVSPSVFAALWRSNGREASSTEPGLQVSAKDFPALAWIGAYDRVERSRVDGLGWMDDDRQWHDARPDDWTGCVAIRAYRQSAAGEEDLRTYCFDRGRPAYWRVQRSDGRLGSIDESVELDGDAAPLFERRRTESGNGESDAEPQRWSRLLQEARPEVKQSRPAFDVPALQREAEDVRRLIKPDFKH